MYKIQWWNELSGTINIGWSKNAALPIIAAALLIDGKVTLTNVPEIGDVFTFLNIIKGIGVKIQFENHILHMDSSDLKEAEFDLEEMKKIRVSILLLAPLLERLGKISIPTPWGCNLGKRPIDSHLGGLTRIWYTSHVDENGICLEGITLSGDITINAWLWVTSTENLLVANVLRQGKTTIKMSAIEPHVMNLIDFLRKAGAHISIRYDHTIIVEGVKVLDGNFECEIISDYIQSWSYMIMGALASKKNITITNARLDDLYVFLEKLSESGVKFDANYENDSIVIYRAKDIVPVKIQTNIYPWFPTDLQAPFAVLMTQAEWISYIHEVLFEWRLGWLVELEKMWLNKKIMNPHEAEIIWKADLQWNTVTSWDLRAGCAVVIAWLIAEWTTIVTNIAYIKRGYEDFVNNLQWLWACIQEIEE